MKRPSVKLTLLFLLAITGLASACEQQREGAVKVVVIGEPPEIVEPAAGPLSPGEALLLANVAQGLVRFDARGQIEPGLAERWNVSDDGLSYIFRLAASEWPDGRRITAYQAARILRRQIGRSSGNPIRDTLGAIDEVVAMTDRVLEIRLSAPRPNLLQLLAQPEMALVLDGQGSGPFRLDDDKGPNGELRLVRSVAVPDEDEERREEVLLASADVRAAVRAFADGRTDLVLGGGFADLPYARQVHLPRNALQFDPVSGLFGLVPARADGPVADIELRRLLTQAIDREAMIAALDVPGLLPRATVLEAGLDDVPDPAVPAWAAAPIAERRPLLAAEAQRLFGEAERPLLRIELPDGPGSELLLRLLARDWGALGIRVERAAPGQGGDLRLVDAVAPSTSPAWFLRRFRCGETPVCEQPVDELLEAARAAPVAAQRAALLYEAAQLVDAQQLFIPIAAPVRWSLVSERVEGFAGNRFAIHTLTGLGERLMRERAE